MSWDDETRNTLIEILVAPGVKNLNDSPKFNRMKKKYGEGHRFYRIADNVQYVYELLEAGMAECESLSQAEVTTCLDQQLGYLMVSDCESMRVCGQLGLKGWSETWAKDQIDYFKKVNVLFDCEMKDYFLSFTGQKPTTLNSLHAGLFISRFSADLYSAEKNKKNLLAKAINHIFLAHPLKGYYYHDSEDDNRLLGKELEKECRRCLVLVQIIQKKMFEGPVKDNYCYSEFKTFEGSLAAQVLGIENAIKFVLGDCTYEEIEAQHPVPPPYRKWHELVKAKKVMSIPQSDEGKEFGESTGIAREKIRDLAGQIEKARNQLVERVPL